ncbi:MAG: hypothetical protein HWE23_06595 [Rhodobacteraceae bacterium]|nr:hypothetical protein [Paracoccaceae bacterium]
MPSTIERSVPPNVVAHATEYPPDRRDRNQGQGKEHGSESDTQRHDDPPGTPNEVPGAYIISHSSSDHCLDGVNAYTSLGAQSTAPRSLSKPSGISLQYDEFSAGEVKHAYEDHSDEEERHKVNVAT